MLGLFAAAARTDLYTLRHGLGVDFGSGRTVLIPHVDSRVIFYDPAAVDSGPTVQNGRTIYWRNTLAKCKLLARFGDFGDWVLVKGGHTFTERPGDMRVSGGGFGAMSGRDARYMAVWGTYDPAAPYDWTRANILRARWQPSAAGSMLNLPNADQHDIAIIAWDLIELSTGPSAFTVRAARQTRILLERVTWENMQLSFEGDPGYGSSMAASTTAAVDCTIRHCGGLFGNDLTSGRYSNLYVHNTKGFRLEFPALHKGGWGQAMTRSTGPWGHASYVNPPGAGPDTFKHCAYFTAWNQNATIVHGIGSFDASLSKFHGDGATVRGWIDIDCPAGLIVGDGSSQLSAWPIGQVAQVRDHLQVHSDDINYASGANLGWGPSMASVRPGSEYVGGVCLSMDNPTTINRTGWRSQNSDGLGSSPTWRQSVALDFANPVSSVSGAGSITKTEAHNLTHQASPGGSSLNAAAVYAARGIVRSRTLQQFADGQGIVYSGGTARQQREVICAHMARNPGVRWAPMLARHFRSELQR